MMNYQLLCHSEDLGALAHRLRNLLPVDVCGFDCEFSGPELPSGDLDFTATKLVGFSVSINDDAFYIPVRHVNDPNAKLPAVHHLLGAVVEAMRTNRVWVWSAEAELQSLFLEGIDYGADSSYWWDGAVMTWLCGDGTQPALKQRAMQLFPDFGHLPNFSEVAKGKQAHEVPVSVLAPYGAKDAWLGAKCGEAALAKLQAWDPSGGLLQHYKTIDAPCLEILRAMRHTGMAVDLPAFESMHAQFAAEAAELAARFCELTTTVAKFPFREDVPTGETYKNGKPKTRKGDVMRLDVRGATMADRNVSYFCYELLGVWPTAGLKRTGTGFFPTDRETLERFLPLGGLAAELVELRLAHSLRDKLLSTYLGPIAAQARASSDGRIHGRQALTGTDTQRFSHSAPNLANLPSRSAEGKRIRAAFVAGTGRKFWAVDLSQAELRIMAHMSRDPELELVYALGEDIHAGMLAEIQKHWPEAQRVNAKTTVFSSLYRITAPQLAIKAKVSEEKAEVMLAAFFARFARVAPFHEQCFAYVEKHGYMRTIDGFRRPLDNKLHRDRKSGQMGLHWSVKNQACNVPIQGSVSGLVKQAMIAVDTLWKTKGWTQQGLARMLSSEHDSLVGDATETVVEEAVADVKRILETVWANRLRVAMVADSKVGNSWGDCK